MSRQRKPVSAYNAMVTSTNSKAADVIARKMLRHMLQVIPITEAKQMHFKFYTELLKTIETASKANGKLPYDDELKMWKDALSVKDRTSDQETDESDEDSEDEDVEYEDEG